MDPILQVLLSWQFVLFSLAVAAVMYVIRIVVEFILVEIKIDPKKPQWWNDLVMPILPVIIGCFAAVNFTSFPYPDGLTTKGDRIVFGLVAGLLSTLLYRVFKALLYQKIQSLVQSLPGADPTPVLAPTPALPTPVAPVPDPTVVAPVAAPVSDSSAANIPPRGTL